LAKSPPHEATAGELPEVGGRADPEEGGREAPDDGGRAPPERGGAAPDCGAPPTQQLSEPGQQNPPLHTLPVLTERPEPVQAEAAIQTPPKTREQGVPPVAGALVAEGVLVGV